MYGQNQMYAGGTPGFYGPQGPGTGGGGMPGYSLQGPYGPRGKPVNIPGFSPSIPSQGQIPDQGQVGIQPIRAPIPQPSFGNYQGFGGGMAGIGQGMPMMPFQMPSFGGFQGFGRPAFPGLGMPILPPMGSLASVADRGGINLMNAGIGSMVDEIGQAPVPTSGALNKAEMVGAAQNQSLDRLRNMARRILGRRSGGGTPGGGGMGPSNEYSRASIF